jgi:Bacteriophage head to tail connecting protein
VADDSSGLPKAPALRRDGVSEVDHYLRYYHSLRVDRAHYDRKWQLCSDYILARRDFTVATRPNQLRPHRITSQVATQANARSAAFVLAYLIDPTRPNLLPNVKRGLAMAGRETCLDDDSLQYVNDVAWSVFDRMMLPRARLMLSLNAMLQEFCCFGCGVIWTGRKRGFGPYYQARPLEACWWCENEQGEVDTLYFRQLMPVWRIIQRWPKAGRCEGWEHLDERPDSHDEQTMSPVLICVEPREGGLYGAVQQAKPFKYVVIAEEKKAILEESGFDSFPYAVFRYNNFPGRAYSEGMGVGVLAEVMVLNHLQMAIEDIVEQKAMPPLAWPARMFPKPLDRRPGAPNAYNPAGLGIQSAKDAIIKLDLTGDPSGVLEHIKYLTEVVERGYFVDWMNLRESGDMTAEEVTERRDIRLRGMASIVSNCEMPMTTLGDRTLDGLKEEMMLPRPVPAGVAGALVDWEYAGPLAIAQLRGNVQSLLQLIQARGLVAGQDPAAAQAVNLETTLRAIHSGLGLPQGAINSEKTVQAFRAQMQAQQQQAADAAKLKTVADAAKSGAGAASDLADAHSTIAGAGGAGGPGGGGPPPGLPAPAGAAPFAPTNPLAAALAAGG